MTMGIAVTIKEVEKLVIKGRSSSLSMIIIAYFLESLLAANTRVAQETRTSLFSK